MASSLFTETWLTADKSDSELFLQNYQLYRSERNANLNSKHGCVMVGVRNNITSFPIDVKNLNDKLTSAFAGSLITVNDEKVLVLCLYNNPSNSKYRVTIDEFNSFFCFLDNDECREIKVIVVGDFNLPSLNGKTLESADLYEKQLVDLFDCQNFIPVVFFPTCGKNILDQIFVNDDSIVIDVNCDDSLLKTFSLSDHIPILLDLDLSPTKNEKTELHKI